MSTELVNRAIAKYCAAIREMDSSAWSALFTEDGYHENVGGDMVKGREALQQFLTFMTGLFEKVDIRETFVFVVGDLVALKWEGKGIGKNGKQIFFEGIDLWEMTETGAIASVKAYWNPAALLAELQS